MNDSFRDLTPFVYGTTRLGDESIPFEERISIAREAVAAGLWLHTSHQYGDALNVLRTLFEDDVPCPPTIFKLGYGSAEEVRAQVIQQLDAIGAPSMAVGQVFPSGQLAEDLCSGGAGIDGLAKLKEEGLVGRFEMEVWPWSSDIAVRCIRGGHAGRLIEAYTFYLNPLQRFVSNELWDLLAERNLPIVAMRTVGGGDVRQIVEREAAPEYLRKRASEIVPIFEKSGVESWAEFAVRFALGFPHVRATVGSTARKENLAEFILAAARQEPLDPEIVREILVLQRSWADDHDAFAAPWSM